MTVIQPSRSHRLPERMPRCCGSHPDWSTLSKHLAAQFPTIHDHVNDEVARARAAVLIFGLPAEEQIPTVELIVRHQLMLLTGQILDGSRLDPEKHRHRKHHPDVADTPSVPHDEP